MGSRRTEDGKKQQAQSVPEEGSAVRVTEMAVAQGGLGIEEFLFAFRLGEGSLLLMGAMGRRGEGTNDGAERNAAGEMSLRGSHTSGASNRRECKARGHSCLVVGAGGNSDCFYFSVKAISCR